MNNTNTIYYLGSTYIEAMTPDEAYHLATEISTSLERAGLPTAKIQQYVDARFTHQKPDYLYSIATAYAPGDNQHISRVANTYKDAISQAHEIADAYQEIVEVCHIVDGRIAVVLPDSPEFRKDLP